MGAFGWSLLPPEAHLTPPLSHQGNTPRCAVPASSPSSPVRTRTPTRSSAWDAASMRAATAARYGPRAGRGGQNTSEAVLMPPQSTRGWCWTRGGFGEKAGRDGAASCMRCSAGLSCGLCAPAPLQSCGTPLSPEPTEDGCYPLGQHLLCKSCHVRRRNESSC